MLAYVLGIFANWRVLAILGKPTEIVKCNMDLIVSILDLVQPLER